MLQIALQDEEAKTLHEILSDDLSDLRMEIAGTENKRYRDELKRREDFLNRVLVKISGSGTSASEKIH